MTDCHSFGGFVFNICGTTGMRKYILLTVILALCACNNGGGSIHGSGQIPEVPGEIKPIMQLNRNAIDFSEYYEYIDGNEILHKEPFTFWKGYINPETGVFHSDVYVYAGMPYEQQCTKDNGCDIIYQNGEIYYDGYDTDENGFRWYNNGVNCQDSNGCSHHVSKDDWMFVYCRDSNGCKTPDSGMDILLKDFKNGKYITETLETGLWLDPDGSTYPIQYKQKQEIAFGSADQDVPLRFSEFGYLNTQNSWTDGTLNHNDYTRVFTAGDTAKEINMRVLAELEKVQTVQTYTGKAYVGISSPVFMTDDSKESSHGFVASGTAKVTFDPTTDKHNPTEYIMLGFSDAGWYNMYMNSDGTGVRFWGNPQVGDEFKFANAPTKADDISVHYYGDDVLNTATEAVGTAGFSAVQMQDNEYRDINFSFGAVRD